mgnify:CR=1 FL=1
MFKRSKLDKVLKQIKKSRNNYFSGELNNIVFLDFDGVLNLDINNYTGNFKAKEPIENLNKFCLENEFKIVVISSWRKSLNYMEILYESGLDRRIEILGATETLEKDRETEVIDYLEKHQNINKFIILDDGNFYELKKYQIQTIFEKGFDNKKYQEAIELIKTIKY